MPIRCPQCGTKYDVTEFEEGTDVKCSCGFMLGLSLIETVDDFLKFFDSEKERKAAEEIQKDAQTVCWMILDESYPAVDIEIAKNKLKEKVSRLFPDKVDTYRMIYEARFERLWQQFRKS